MTKRILITGASGFIGANLANYFHKEKQDVGVILRENSNLWRLSDILDDIITYRQDILDLEALNRTVKSFRPDVIIHTAAFGAYYFETDQDMIYTTNFTGTKNVVESYIQSDSELLINTGSSSEYGFKDKPMAETNVLEPIGDYAVSKAASTILCRSKSIESQRKILTFRLFSAFGYYEESHRLVPYLMQSYLKGNIPKLNNPNNVRDFIFIEDICNAYNEAIKRADDLGCGEILNLGCGIQYRVKDVVEIVKKIAGKNISPIYINDIGRIGDKAINWEADTLRAYNVLKFKPKYSLEEGLYETYQWFSNNIEKYEVVNNSKLRRNF